MKAADQRLGGLRAGWPGMIGLLILGVIAYGPLVSRLGVYWDDWPSLWFLDRFGPGVFPEAFAQDRPVQGWLFVLTTAVFGEWMPGWQVFGLLARVVNALTLAWVLRLVWPQQADKTRWIAALFLVYPGFSQQLIPITYGHQFLIYTAFLTSLALMLMAQRAGPRRRWWALTLTALALAVWSMFALEYFFGLELLRPALLWLAVYNASEPEARKLSQLTRKTLQSWLPYALAAGLFLVWRVSNPTPRASVVIFERLAAQPVHAVLTLIGTMLNDGLEAAILAWARTLTILSPERLPGIVWPAGIGVALAAAGVTFWLARPTPAPWSTPGQGEARAAAPEGGMRWGTQAVLLGLYALAVGGWPVWATDLRLELAFPWDRFTLQLIPGATLVLAGVIDWLPVRRLGKAVVVAGLVGLAAGAQFHYALDYQRDWKAQQAFFWQLAWRAPQIEPGTLLLTAALPFPYVTDNSLTAPLNWVYAPEHATRQMPYLMYALEARLGTELAALEPGTPVVEKYRATQFKGSTDQALVLFYDPPRCLKVLDPRVDGDLPNKPEFIPAALGLSRPELIAAQPAAATQATLERLFGPEPEHGWCYYVEKADLAAAQGDWEAAAALASPALAANPDLGREQAYELLPFIQGYAYTGEWEQAVELSQLAARLFSGKMPAILCDLWQQIEKNAPAGAETAAEVEAALTQLNCPAQ